MAIAKLTVDLEARLANFERDLNRMVSASQSTAKRIEAAFSGVSNIFGGLVGGAAVGVAVTAFRSLVDNIDKLDESAERAGVSIESLSALEYAGRLSGAEFEDITTALTKLSVKMQESISGNKEAQSYFSALGVTVTDASGKLKTADVVFAEVADAFAGMEDGAGKTALAVEGFGRSGAKLVPMLNQGAAGLQEMKSEGKALGAVLNDDLAKQAARFNDNIDKLRVIAAGAGRSLVESLIPSLNQTAEAMIRAREDGSALDAAIRGFVGLGKLPLDLYFGMPDMDVSVTAQIRNLQKEVASLENKKKDATESGLLGRLVFGEIGELDKQLEIAKNQLATLQKFKTQLETKPAVEGQQKRQPPKIGVEENTKASKKDEDAARLIERLNEQIALKAADLEAIDKLNAAEQQRVQILFQLDAGTLKASAAQRERITTALDELVIQERAIQAQKEYTDALFRQEQANAKANETLLDQIAAAEREADLYGLSAAQISVVEQARLADAIAIARQNGAGEDQIAFLEEELRLRGQLSDALIAVDVKKTSLDLKEQTSIAKDLGMTFSSAFEDAVAGGKKFRDILEGIAQDIARILLRKNITEPFAAAIGGIDFASIFGFANGGIMTSAGPLPLRQYASGGVASSPQLALFGEGSRPEAFVPLPDGRRIPVAMEGGGSNVVINVNNTASDTKASASAREDSSGTTIIDIVVERVESSMARRISQGGGVAPLLERRYGLNPAAGAVR